MKITGAKEVDPGALEKFLRRKMTKITEGLFDKAGGADAIGRHGSEFLTPAQREYKTKYRNVVRHGTRYVRRLTRALSGASDRGLGVSVGLDIMWMLKDFEACKIHQSKIDAWTKHYEAMYAGRK